MGGRPIRMRKTRCTPLLKGIVPGHSPRKHSYFTLVREGVKWYIYRCRQPNGSVYMREEARQKGKLCLTKKACVT